MTGESHDRQGASLALAGRSVRRAFSPRGRATRAELVSYLLATLAVSIPLSSITSLALPYDAHRIATDAITVLLAIPAPALLVRRMHDQDRSGAWAFLALPGFALWLVRTLVSAIGGIDARLAFDGWTWPLDWLVIVSNIACLILVLQAGTGGRNRFGDNPRAEIRPGSPNEAGET